MMFSSRSPLALFSVLSTRCPQLHDYPLSVLFLENSLMTPTSNPKSTQDQFGG